MAMQRVGARELRLDLTTQRTCLGLKCRSSLAELATLDGRFCIEEMPIGDELKQGEDAQRSADRESNTEPNQAVVKAKGL